MHIAVIGSGLAGLSAACTLAARGYTVDVFDKNPWLGGKAAVLEEQGFRFDMGPTILIQPSVLRRIFCEAGRSLEDYIEMVRLDPQWRCFFDNGSVLDLKDDVREMAAALDARAHGHGCEVCPVSWSFLKSCTTSPTDSFSGSRWDRCGTRFNSVARSSLRVLKDVMRMRLGQTVAGTIRSFIDDPQVAQMLDHYVQYVGSAPDNSPAILCSIGHMQAEEGIWYPMGGTRAVPEALVRLGKELGVAYHPSTEVERILIEGGQVSG